MTADEIIELRDNITKLTGMIGEIFVFGMETGQLVLLKEGVPYNLENVLRHNRPGNPDQQRAVDLAVEINEAMAQYIAAFGKLPPEIGIQ